MDDFSEDAHSEMYASTSTLRPFPPNGGSTLRAWQIELDEYREVLVGRVPPPINNGIMTMMEVADAYLARAREMEGLLHSWEAAGTVIKGSSQYRFRTGELRSFIEMARSAVELGSRRVTAAKMEYDQRD